MRSIPRIDIAPGAPVSLRDPSSKKHQCSNAAVHEILVSDSFNSLRRPWHKRRAKGKLKSNPSPSWILQHAARFIPQPPQPPILRGTYHQYARHPAINPASQLIPIFHRIRCPYAEPLYNPTDDPASAAKDVFLHINIRSGRLGDST
ncbi:hypothetical protein Hypma_003939 [Hypsizygus marmoreus]|uniref:Uncharacterized protein n=1 Tax=Hypsizygus marmoreus TaxID=39966 RepID=A0A369J0X9_HYPMA|nr:hypothetical protein Hypma_003939 [Hypsizygus marmoreus]